MNREVQGSAGRGLGLSKNASACASPSGKVSPTCTHMLKGKSKKRSLLLLSPLPSNVLAWTLESDGPGFKSQFFCLIHCVNWASLCPSVSNLQNENSPFLFHMFLCCHHTFTQPTQLLSIYTGIRGLT